MAENTTNETRFVGNVTKSTTGATLFAGSILTIVNYGLAQAGITIPAEVQTAAVTVILGLVVLITGRNTRGEKAHLEGAIQGETAAALANLDLYEVLEAIADGVAADARNAAPHEADGRAAFEEYTRALRTVLERNAVVLDDGSDADVFSLVSDDLDAAVHVFHVRGGRIRGTRGWVIERVDGADDAALMARLLEQVYSSASPDEAGAGKTAKVAAVSVDDVAHTPTSAIPREVLVSVDPEEGETIARWLAEIRGASVSVHVPKRGPKAQIMDTVTENARQALALHRTKRAGDITARSKALEQLAENLDLPGAPLRIECYDVSHTGGENQVASMVVFEDGMPRKDAYRTYNIRGEDGNGTPDDTSAMNEVLTRRFSRLLAEEAGVDGEDEDGVAYASGPIDATTGRPKRFSYRPDLVVVDGGLPQVNAARAALDAVGADVPVVGLAKRLEEVWIPGDDFPLILPRTSEALYLLQYLRDESHRFAITKHRKRRSKAQRRSVLDSIPGLGPTRQAALLKHFGSVKRIREATPEQIAEVKGVGLGLARTIRDRLAASSREDTP